MRKEVYERSAIVWTATAVQVAHTYWTACQRLLAERVWCTKFQSSLLNIYFRLNGFQPSLLLIYIRSTLHQSIAKKRFRFATTWQGGHDGGQYNIFIFSEEFTWKCFKLFLTTNMAAMTSGANQQSDVPPLRSARPSLAPSPNSTEITVLVCKQKPCVSAQELSCIMWT